MAEARVGKLTNINYSTGMARVTYTDKDSSVTQEIPFISSEYKMPPIGSQVLVLHLSNANEMGIILGRPWSSKTKPFEGKKGLYRKELSSTEDEAFIRYDEVEKDFQLKLPKALIESYEKEIDINSKDAINIKAEEKCSIIGKEIIFKSESGEITIEDLIKIKNTLGI